jgi:DNA-binding NtrC family response regulator
MYSVLITSAKLESNRIMLPQAPNPKLYAKSADSPMFEDASASTLVIESPSTRELFRIARRIGPTSAPTLLLGETGTGKEVLARFIYAASGRPLSRFKSINCAALPPQLIESALFGHERGAFTGAVKRTAGIFEQAQGGAVFLDEVGELRAEAQAALLRVLETGRVTRIGSEYETEIDARIIAATHRNLGRCIAEGTFRQDLLYRLNAITLELPPLRERREEILPLASAFLERTSERWCCDVRELSLATTALLMSYAWPGNVRELRNVIERGVLMCEGRVLEPPHLPAAIRGRSESAARPTAVPAGEVEAAKDTELDLRDALRRYEVQLIEHALARAEGNQRRAAQLLNIPRRTLVRKLRELRAGSFGTPDETRDI